MMRSANPTLREDTFTKFSRTGELSGAGTMTISGTVNKTAILLFLLVIGATWAWQQVTGKSSDGLAVSMPMSLIVCSVAAFIISMIIIFKQNLAPYLAPVYAVTEGVLLGTISAFFEMRYGGIILQAVLATFGTLYALLFAYKSGFIKATENFKLGVFAATGGLAIMYLLTMVVGFFGVKVPYIHDSGPIGIGISVVACVVAALNLVMDFDFIEQGEAARAPKFMEWYAAFGLLVTLVWLYMEILRLLAKSRKK